jgi:hypothetical protein
LAGLSLEVAHLYLQESTPLAAREEARREARWALPLVESFAAAGVSVSTCVLIDDTSGGAAADVDAVAARQVEILEACAEAGMAVDYVVRESSCESSVEEMLAYYYPQEADDAAGRLGTGQLLPTVDTVGEDDCWLANGEPGRSVPVTPVLRLPGARRSALAGDPPPRRRTGSRGSRSHSIHLDVELWSWEKAGRRGTMISSCPLLAAWWQLLRLGVLVGDAPPTTFAPTPLREDSPPFAARATLTVLPPGFLVVEHAVRTILNRVAAPPGWFAWQEQEPRDGDLRHQPHLDRISYLFAGAIPPSDEP